MKRTSKFRRYIHVLVVAAFGCAVLAAAAGWQFLPGPQAQRPPQPQPPRMQAALLQRQIDAMPRDRGGIVRLTGNVITDRPIRLWNHVTLDLNGHDLHYNGPARDANGVPVAALIFADRSGSFERHGGGVCNGWIIGNGRAIDREAGEWNLLNVRIGPNLTIGVELDGIDLTRSGWGHRVIIDDVWFWRPGGRAINLNANLATIRNVTVKGGPRRPGEVPDEYVKVCGATGGGGVIENLWVEAYNAEQRESVTQLAITGGGWTVIQGHLEQPGPKPAVLVRGTNETSVVYVTPAWYLGMGMRAEGGVHANLTTAYPMEDAFFEHDATSTITVNGVKRGKRVSTTK